MKQEADVIIVGSGAGGATLARELARAGKDVLILERGRDHRRFMGTHFGAMLMADRLGMRFSKEGVQCVRALTTGGSTLLTCGTFREPAPFIKESLGIDLTEETAVVKRELGAQPLPDRLLKGTPALFMEAADSLGYKWQVFDKFIDAKKCREGCSACMLGCPTGAKWTARRFVDDAVEAGATILQPANVKRVLSENGRATGVVAKVGGRRTELRAPLVVLAAGGMGSAPILRSSGIEGAGKGVFLDPLVVVYGTYGGKLKGVGTCYNAPMTVGSWEFYKDEGFMLSPLVDPWFLFIAQMGLAGPTKPFKVARYPRIMGVMVKIKDDIAGEVFENGSFSKPLSAADQRKLDRGTEVSTEVLVKAGCKPAGIVRTPVRGAHPGGACRIGEVVDRNLETDLRGLYVADASVFPEALGTPVVATVAAMSKRLARHLLAAEG